MLIQPTIEKLCAMRLRGMAEAFQQQQQDANIHSLSFEERLGLLIDRSGTGARTGRWTGACATDDCKARLASRTSTTAHRAGWIVKWCVP